MSGASYVKDYEVADSRQFLTFKLAGEEYGVGILAVKEIRGWSAVTAVPHSPPWMLGVINLRGVVVPIIDLRLKFHFNAEYNELTVVIVISVGDQLAGIVVDGVSDVITLANADIKPPPSLGGHANTSHIIGFGTVDDRMRILVDVERLLAGTDMGAANAMQ